MAQKTPQLASKPLPQKQNVQAEASPALISLFRSASVYVLRIADIRYNPVALAIAKHLTDADSLVVVTPTDTKMFNLIEGKEIGSAKTTTTIRETPAPYTPYESVAGADAFADDPQSVAQQLAREADATAAEAGITDTTDLQDQINHADTPAARRKAMMEMRKAESSGVMSTCGRCRGVGQVPVALEGGGTTSAACPVCQGKGGIRRYGAGR